MLAVPGEAGSFCTIASSDFDAIPVGSRVVYAKAATADGGLDTDILVNTPSGDTAHGHVVLDGATQTGKVTLAGGTGELAKLAADLLVAPRAEPNYSWEGPYSYRERPARKLDHFSALIDLQAVMAASGFIVRVSCR
jgi:hypothetical protein